MECSIKCLLCHEAKQNYVNYSKYHGACKNERFSTDLVVCIHCQSKVPILVFTEIKPPRHEVGSGNSEECSDIVQPNQKNISLLRLGDSKNYSSGIEQLNSDPLFNLEKSIRGPDHLKRENFSSFNGLNINLKQPMSCKEVNQSANKSQFYLITVSPEYSKESHEQVTEKTDSLYKVLIFVFIFLIVHRLFHNF